MTVKTRNRLITLSILAAPFCFLPGSPAFLDAEPLPPVAPLPNPNGYDDLVKAGQMITGDPGNYNQLNEQQLRASWLQRMLKRCNCCAPV